MREVNPMLYLPEKDDRNLIHSDHYDSKILLVCSLLSADVCFSQRCGDFATI